MLCINTSDNVISTIISPQIRVCILLFIPIQFCAAYEVKSARMVRSGLDHTSHGTREYVVNHPLSTRAALALTVHSMRFHMCPPVCYI